MWGSRYQIILFAFNTLCSSGRRIRVRNRREFRGIFGNRAYRPPVCALTVIYTSSSVSCPPSANGVALMVFEPQIEGFPASDAVFLQLFRRTGTQRRDGVCIVNVDDAGYEPDEQTLKRLTLCLPHGWSKIGTSVEHHQGNRCFSRDGAIFQLPASALAQRIELCAALRCGPGWSNPR